MIPWIAFAATQMVWLILSPEILPLYGQAKVYAVCLILALPVALGWSCRFPIRSLSLRRSAAVLGLVLPGLLGLLWVAIEPVVSFTGIDWALRMVLRPLIALAILLPWTVLLVNPAWASLRDPGALVGLGALALVGSGSYANLLAEKQKVILQERKTRDLVVPCLESIRLLAQWEGWDGPEGARRFRDGQALIRAELALNQSVARPLPTVATAKERWKRAVEWIRLGKNQNAQWILDELGQDDPLAGLLAASLDRIDKRWTDAELRYRTIMEARSGSLTPEDRFAAIEGLAEALQGLGRFEELAALWSHALESFPEKSGSILFNRAMAQASQGRYRDALSSLGRAEQADPSQAARVAAQKSRMIAHSPACLPWPWTGPSDP